MAGRTKAPKSNRYKKSGKGATILAVFLVMIVSILVGGYYFFVWDTDSEKLHPRPADNSKVVTSVTSRIQPAHSSTAAKTTETPVTKPAGPEWEHYTGDTVHDEPVAKPAATVKKAKARAELAIIVDDMGSSIQEAKNLAAIGVPITFSIIPGLRHDREVASLAKAEGVQVMLHIPMQPREYPQRRLEQNGLLLSHDDEEIKNRFQQYITLLPQAVGANNHMGSGFSEDNGKMRLVLGLLKQRGMFYVDSITTPETVGPRLIKELEMRGGRRDVFLDNEQNESYIRGQLAKAEDRAIKYGHAIAICHPHPATIATLAKVLPEMKKKGISFVYASKAVR